MNAARMITYQLSVPDQVIRNALAVVAARVEVALTVAHCPIARGHQPPQAETPGAMLTEICGGDAPRIEIIHYDQEGIDCRPFLARYAGALETARIPHALEDAFPTQHGGWYGRINVLLAEVI